MQLPVRFKALEDLHAMTNPRVNEFLPVVIESLIPLRHQRGDMIYSFPNARYMRRGILEFTYWVIWRDWKCLQIE